MTPKFSTGETPKRFSAGLDSVRINLPSVAR